MATSKEFEQLDSRFYQPAEVFFPASNHLGLTYDDVTLATCYSEVLPRDTQLDTTLAEGLHLNIPIISSDMDTVTEARMAIAMALNGGMGLIHYNMPEREQLSEVSRVIKITWGWSGAGKPSTPDRMKKLDKSKNNRACNPPQANVETDAPKAKTIKLGIDVHLERYVVVRTIDGGTPQPAQGFQPAQFLLWVAKQLTLAEKVFTCYEAGPFGYSLHRKLEKMGATNYVVRPRDWDEYGKKVKTDKRDAKELALHLDRYVNGNHETFCVVRVPTPEEEQERSISRQRESFQRERQRLAAQGRSHALYYGEHIRGEWWQDAVWKTSATQLPTIVVNLLEPLRRLIGALEVELKARTREVEAAAPERLPVGLGKLTSEILEREVVDWNRFQNRRQVASYTGLCPSEDSSSQRRFQGSINKHGNRRLRPVLVEGMWRLSVFQPEYRVVKKWRPELLNPKTSRPRRKKIIVAMARAFSVDWWRVRTGRCTAEDLGLHLQPPSQNAKAKGQGK